MRNRGYSLIETVLALTLAAVVLGAGGRLLLALRRFAAAEREALFARQNARVAGWVLAAELRGVSPRGGDLLRMSDTAVTLRAMRGLALVCAAPAPGALAVVVRDDPAVPARTPVPGRDSVVGLLLEGDGAADHWVHAGVAGTGGGVCADGTRGVTLRLTAGAGAAAALDSLEPGAPLRLFETLSYRLYNDGTGTWWLGVRSWQGGSWAATSPLAGPLRPRDGLTLQFLDRASAATTTDTAVHAVAITVRAVAVRAVATPGRHAGRHEDSLTVIVAPRNE